MTTKNITHNELSQIVKEEITGLTIAHPEPRILTLADVLLERRYPEDPNRPNKVLYRDDDVKVVIRPKGEMTLAYATGEITKIHKAEDSLDDRIDIALENGKKLYKVLPEFVFLSTQAPPIKELIFGPDAEGLQPRAAPSAFTGVAGGKKADLTTREGFGKALSAGFEELGLITFMKLELAKWVLSELGVTRNKGFMGKAIPAFFANIRWTQIEDYIKRDTGPELIADAFVDSLTLMASETIFKESLQDILGLSPQEDKISDAFFSYINVNLSTSISEGAVGKIIKAKVADALRTVSLRTLMNTFFDESTIDKANLAWIPVRAWLEHYLKTTLSWEGVDLSKLDIDTTIFEGIIIDCETNLLESSQTKQSELYTLSRAQLRSIIVEEISVIDGRQLQTQSQINEVVWVKTLLKGLAGTSAGLAVTYYFRKEILKAIDDTALGEFLKNEISGSILSILGAEKDKGLIGKVVPIVVQNIKLHKLEDYFKDETSARELATLIVGSMSNIVADQALNYALKLLGVDVAKRSKIGDKIIKYVSILIAKSFKQDSRLFAVMVDELTIAISGVDIEPIIEKAKEEMPAWKRIMTDIVSDYTGVLNDKEE